MWIDDQILEKCSNPLECRTFVPEKPVVVLGASNKPEAEVHQEHCLQDGVPVLKRYGGGGTVLLYDGVVVISLGTWVKQPYANTHYFQLLNQSVIDALRRSDEGLEEVGFDQRGLSDIVVGPQKFCGTSLFRSRNYLLYQASLIVDLDLERIARYLPHPSREPDYRQGRSHRDFLTGLGEISKGISTPDLCQKLVTAFPDCVRDQLHEEFIDPQPKHIPHLLRRVDRAKEAEK